MQPVLLIPTAPSAVLQDYYDDMMRLHIMMHPIIRDDDDDDDDDSHYHHALS